MFDSIGDVTKLDNGVNLLVEEIHGIRSVAIGIFVDCGSAFERPEQNGISHFIEHLNFKGTNKRTASQIAEELDSIGGKLNAYTGKEHTVYYIVVLEEYIDIAIDLISDIFLNAKYDEQQIETEKQVILQEIKMYEDNTEQYIHDLFVRNIWPGFYLGQPIIGTREIVANLTKKDILKYIKEHYLPEHITVSVVGKCNKEETIKKINKYLGKFQSEVKREKMFPLPDYKSAINIHHKETNQVHFCVGTRGISYHNPNRYPLLVLSTILGGSMSSILFQEVREKRGLVYSISSYPMYFRDCGLFSVYAGASADNAQEVLQIILDTFKKIPEYITKEKVDKVKNQLKTGIILGLESSLAKMTWNGRNFFYYRKTFSIQDIAEEIDSIKINDIIKLCTYLFDEKYYSLTAIGNIEKNFFDNILKINK
jgi:predicted Zn-dependent peptidase